jgi:hypothetical protein
MANKNTKMARKAGFASLKDMQSSGTKVFKGSICDTAWDNSNCKRNYRKTYKS